MDGKEEKMYVIPLGGLEEVGKNMTAFQYKDEIIVVDAGLTFPEDEHLGIDVIIPDFSYLESNRHKIKGLLLTHGHEDHIGAIPYFYQKLGTENIPMYGGRLTLALARAKFEKKDAKLPKEYQNPNGYFEYTKLSGSAALLLNKDVFKELGLDAEKFNSYEDLLEPKLKGHIAMGDPTNSSSAWAELTNMLLVKGKEPYDDAAWDWVAKFVDQLDGTILSSSSQIYKGTADGEYAVGVSYEDPCVSLLEDGAENLRVVYPSEGAVWLPAGAAIVKGAKNEENAKKFIDFLISEEGQEALKDTTIRPVMTSVENTSEFMPPFSKIKVAYEDIKLVAEKKEEWQNRWQELVKK